MQLAAINRVMSVRVGILGRWMRLVILMLVCGCAVAPSPAPREVGAAWQAAASPQTDRPASTDPAASAVETSAERSARPIAIVNGQPIMADRLVNILLQNQGVHVLEQIIALDAARRLAAEMGLAVTQEDVRREYDTALRRLYDPLAAVNAREFDRQAAEQLLDTVLAQRKSSRGELWLVVRRNAYLRKIAAARLRITPQQLQQEFRNRYSERVQVRHIQLATPAQVERVRAELRAGVSFEDAAERYSANTASASRGGLLEPFTAHDETVPALLRDTAFTLEPGETSAPLRAGRWYHILHVERRWPAQDVSFDEVRHEVEQALRDRLAESAMEDLFNTLVLDADVTVVHPVLREAYTPKRTAGPGSGQVGGAAQ